MIPWCCPKPGQRLAATLERGLDLCVSALLPLLVIAPHGAAPLVVVAALLGMPLALAAGAETWRQLRGWVFLLAAILVWGLVSALWAVEPGRSLLISARLAGLYAAGLLLIAAVGRIAEPRRLLNHLVAGVAIALILTLVQFVSHGALTRPFRARMFADPNLDQVENAFVLILLPLTAALASRGRLLLAAAAALAMAVAIYSLVGTAAQIAFAAGLAAAVLIYLSRRLFSRLAAAASALLVFAAPVVFPPLLGIDALRRAAEHLSKVSLWHRLEIWSFVGSRIAERPLFGWGLDSSRAIPGGSELFPAASNPWGLTVEHLPLHPHNVTLQIWLELGAPGAVLFAILAARLWLSLDAASWPRAYAAAAGGSLAAAFVAALGSYGAWQEWWIGTELLTFFVVLVLGRLSAQPIPETPRGSIS